MAKTHGEIMPQSGWLRDLGLPLVKPSDTVAFHNCLRLKGFDVLVAAVVLNRTGAKLEGTTVVGAPNTSGFEGRAVDPRWQVSAFVAETIQNSIFSHDQPGAAVCVEDATRSVFQIHNRTKLFHRSHSIEYCRVMNSTLVV
ncbi:MAG: hypothetical protein AAFY60_12715, partial [Myxococcota bacterium]